MDLIKSLAGRIAGRITDDQIEVRFDQFPTHKRDLNRVMALTRINGRKFVSIMNVSPELDASFDLAGMMRQELKAAYRIYLASRGKPRGLNPRRLPD